MALNNIKIRIYNFLIYKVRLILHLWCIYIELYSRELLTYAVFSELP